MASNLQVIAELEKNRSERVRVALDKYRDIDLIDVRVVVPLSGGTGLWAPTKKGLSLRIGQLPALIEALQLAAVEAQALGLLPEGRARAA